MFGRLLALLLLVSGCALFAADDRPPFAKDVVRAVHRLRVAVEKPHLAIPEDRALIKAQVEKLAAASEAAWNEFTRYAYGRGLLYLDEFYEDLDYLLRGLANPETQATLRQDLDAFSFGALASQLVRASLDPGVGDTDWAEPVQQSLDAVSRFEEASKETLAAEDRFLEAAGVQTRKLKWVQSAVMLVVSGFGMHAAWHLLGIDQLSPREFVGFLFSVWAGNEALYWLIWERFKWIDPYKKWTAKAEYEELIAAWNRLLSLSPALTAQKAASASFSKMANATKHADAQADAALEALFQSLNDDDPSNDAAIKEELFRVFLSELEGGNGWRATKILKVLHQRDPRSKAARMSEAVAKVFRIRSRMERKALVYELVKASFRLAVLGLLVYGSNELLKAVLPPTLKQWRLVPNWILAGLGVRRIYPLIWLPHRVESLRRRASREDKQLREAFDELLAIDPSGDIVERIAEYDSGVAAHQLVTFGAVDALAADPSGERTRALWNVINHELSNPHPAGSRVNALLDTTYRAQKSCAMRLLETVRGLGQQFGYP